MSFRRQGVLLSKYSLSPERWRRRVINTSSYGMESFWSELSIVKETSEKLSGFLKSVPEKITSSILEPLRSLGLLSPRTQRMASEMLLFPHPLGPTMHVTPRSKETSVLSANDLN